MKCGLVYELHCSAAQEENPAENWQCFGKSSCFYDTDIGSGTDTRTDIDIGTSLL